MNVYENQMNRLIQVSPRHILSVASLNTFCAAEKETESILVRLHSKRQLLKLDLADVGQ